MLRERIIASLLHAMHRVDGSSFDGIMREIHTRIPESMAYFDGADEYQAMRFQNEIDRAAFHFYHCSDERALDFLEMFFQSSDYWSENKGVEIINGIFREENIGYNSLRTLCTI